jgi:ABC-type glycerol-3-phosphate transport system substrate-binding protein
MAIGRKVLVNFVRAIWIWAACVPLSPALAQVRFFFPKSHTHSLEKELSSIIEIYNRGLTENTEQSRVELSLQGENFSSLKELIARYLAGEAPDLAAIEASELPATQALKLTSPLTPAVKKAIRMDQFPSWLRSSLNIPFAVSVPTLLINTDLISAPTRGRLSWSELVSLAKKRGYTPWVPLQGPRGLWIFETLTGTPLWQREAGGLRTNRSLSGPIGELQTQSHTETTWGAALTAFLDRKTPLLATSSDEIPEVANQATFHWKALPLPVIGGAPHSTITLSGTFLIVLKDSPELQAFLSYLYSSSVALRWLKAGGVLPFRADWRREKSSSPIFEDILRSSSTPRFRSTDTEVVRARSEWIQALSTLFGEASERTPTEMVFLQLDSRLAGQFP